MAEEIKSGIDRRRSERVSKSCAIFSSKHGAEVISQEKITGSLRDISGTGLSFLSDVDYTPGDTLDLQIDLQDSHHQVLVQVARTEDFGNSKIVGVYFIDIASEHEKALIQSLFARR